MRRRVLSLVGLTAAAVLAGAAPARAGEFAPGDFTDNLGLLIETPLAGFGNASVGWGASGDIGYAVGHVRLFLRVNFLSWAPPSCGASGCNELGASGSATGGTQVGPAFSFDGLFGGEIVFYESRRLSMEGAALVGLRRTSFTNGDPSAWLWSYAAWFPAGELQAAASYHLYKAMWGRLQVGLVALDDPDASAHSRGGAPAPPSVGLGLDTSLVLGVSF